MIGRVMTALALAAATVLPVASRAQGRGASKPCEVVITGGDSTRSSMVRTPAGGRNTFIGGGVDATCEGQGNRLLADSAEYFQAQGRLNLYHNVRYTEAGMRLTSDRMTYFTVDERLVAEGNVTGLSAKGTRFAGPRVEYLRDIPGLREHSRLTATGRPFVRMSPTEAGDTVGTNADSTDLTADLVVSENDSLMWASGKVIIERTDIRATADSATLDNGTEYARLLRDPVIVGRGERAFTLDGTVIDLWSRDRRLERVLAADSGRVVSDSLTLTADSVDLRLREQRIERVYAWGTRARADAPAQRIDADSLDIHMPGQRLREVHAVGDARATSRADSTVVTEEPDWIRGDTIVARFDTAAVADSASQPRMREVMASGRASAFYQMGPTDGTKGTPSISYNRGRTIKVAFAEGEMTSVDVVDRASGLFLEPVRADTVAARPTAPNPAPPAGRRP